MKQILEVAAYVCLAISATLAVGAWGLLFAALFDKVTPGDPKTDRVFYTACLVGALFAVLFPIFALSAAAA